jgi:peptidoglycan hydrolase-like protein with peptidoglycan-binding domain
VGAIQDALIALGARIDLGAGAANRGIFGPRTEAAVNDFQRRAGIHVDGQVGKDTIRALDRALAEKRKPRRTEKLRDRPGHRRRRRSRKDS